MRPLEGPLSLTVRFYMPRPKAHLTARCGLKSSAPQWPATRPDTTKLLRAVEDALNGICWFDDSQICVQRAYKNFTILHGGYLTRLEPGAEVEVTHLA